MPKKWSPLLVKYQTFGAASLAARQLLNCVGLTKVCGVYAVKCEVNNKVYIGGTTNVKRRIGNHKHFIEHLSHENALLQSDVIEFGSAAFTYWLIDMCSPEELPLMESFYQRLTRCMESKFGFNIDWVDSVTGKRVCAASTKSKIGIKSTGRKLPDSARLAISNANLGKRHKPRTSEQRERYRIAMTGRKFSAESRSRMSASRKGRIITPEWRARLSSATKGRPKSEETKARMRAAQHRRKENASDNM